MTGEYDQIWGSDIFTLIVFRIVLKVIYEKPNIKYISNRNHTAYIVC